MSTAKVAITLDQATLARLDLFVKRKIFPSRSRAIQEAIADKLTRLERSRLAIECAKLDPEFEKALAEEGLSQDGKATAHELDQIIEGLNEIPGA